MRVILFAVLALLLAASVQADPVKLKLGPEGDILGWLVLGPLPNPGVDHESCKGFDEDYLAALGGEAGAAAKEGYPVDAAGHRLKWKLALASEKGGLDIGGTVNSLDRGVAYAYAAIESDTEREVKLLMGSDDGVKVWVNGEQVHVKHVMRGINRDEDKIDIKLKPGVNRLMFKVDQSIGGWGLMARLVNKDGTPARALTEQLLILPKSQTSERCTLIACRSAAGKSGSLDIAPGLRYEEVVTKSEPMLAHFKAELGASNELAKALNAASAKFKSLGSLKSADSVSRVLAEVAKTTQSVYDSARTALVKEYQNPGPLFKTDPSKEDYISVMPGGRYFMHADGTPFTPIGYNHNADWTTLNISNPDLRDYNPKITDEFFAHLHEMGLNLVRIMIETPGSGLFEDPIGTFRPEHVKWIDNIVNAARKNDVKLMVTPWDTFWMVRRWDICPYNNAIGGPVVDRLDFIVKREVIEAQKKRLKYMIDRWGNSGDIFAWELLNEGDLYWKETPEQLSAWESEMAAYVRDYEKKKWGRNHILASSIAHPMPGGAMADVAYRQPGLDMSTTHLYIGASRGPSEPIQPALDIKKGVTYALDQIKDNRPYIDTEDGPIDRWIGDGNLDDAVFHNMTWAHLTSGGAGSAFRWPYRNPHHLSEGMFAHLSRVKKFADEVPWAKLSGPLSRGFDVQVPDGWIVCRIGTPHAAVAWVRARDWKAPADLTINVTWPDAPAGASYRAYDTLNGTWIGSGTLQSENGLLVIKLTGAPESVALAMEGK